MTSLLERPSGHAGRIVLALVFALPLLFMLVSSFKSDDQVFGDPGSLRAFLPVGALSPDNCTDTFERVPAARFLLNPVLISSITVVLGIVVNSLPAFALSRMRWPGRKLVLTVVIATLIVPFEPFAPPLVRWVNRHAAGAPDRPPRVPKRRAMPRRHRPGEGLGRSRGGLTCTIHLVGEGGLRPLALLIAPGQWGDSPQDRTGDSNPLCLRRVEFDVHLDRRCGRDARQAAACHEGGLLPGEVFARGRLQTVIGHIVGVGNAVPGCSVEPVDVAGHVVVRVTPVVVEPVGCAGGQVDRGPGRSGAGGGGACSSRGPPRRGRRGLRGRASRSTPLGRHLADGPRRVDEEAVAGRGIVAVGVEQGVGPVDLGRFVPACSGLRSGPAPSPVPHRRWSSARSPYRWPCNYFFGSNVVTRLRHARSRPDQTAWGHPSCRIP